MTISMALAGATREIERELLRIDSVLALPPTAERFGLLRLAVSNLSHLQAYLEGNAGFVDTRSATSKIRATIAGDAFQLRCADWLSAASSGAVDTVVTAPWLHWIEEQQDPSARAALVQIDAALSELDAAVRDGESRLRALLQRLGAKTGNYPATTAFMALISSVADSDTRLRLSHAKALVSAETAKNLQGLLDVVVATRFRVGVALERTMEGCSLTRAELDVCLDRAVQSAGIMGQALLDRIAPCGDGEIALASEFPRHLSQNFGSGARLKLPLEPSLDFLGEITERVLGLRVHRAHGALSPIEIYKAGHQLGFIELDCIGATLGVPSQDVGCVPTARIFCRLNGVAPPTLSFDALRMVFHEFGHALVHVLSNERTPSLSGLDHAPIERLELLSTWFEYWIYHCDLAGRLSLGSEEICALTNARAAKLLEAQRSMPGRAICARLDLDLHEVPGLNAEMAWKDAVSRLPGPAPCANDVLTDFTHPLMRHHPGAAFVFPMGQSFAAEKLVDVIDRPLSSLSSYEASLSPAIHNDVAMKVPDAGAVENFFGTVFERISREGNST